ncbi:hypothetical protein [Methanobacterium paludis]|uniref:Uncharacterized protein n=1 Tax=Methanobacterium paludis (strain DSM 25820 / JCM 18151 / SWAN1) TaxID=868131 RepID=F6D4V8_METPW|nr:hypothetical protein [Methanobacterium paludis]AEG18167.1 hypothetical protein MSWAN_1149 [Methanobacterium paludis]
MIPSDNNWSELVQNVTITLSKWGLFDDSRSINTSCIEDEKDELDYTYEIPILKKLDENQLDILKKLNTDSKKTPKFKYIKHETGLKLMIY